MPNFGQYSLSLFMEDKAMKEKETAQPKFETGQLLSTPGVQAEIDREDIVIALARHIRGDWGDVCREDRQENELSLREGFRLFSVYHDRNGVKFWIITEADRSATTMLLPDEY